MSNTHSAYKESISINKSEHVKFIIAMVCPAGDLDHIGASLSVTSFRTLNLKVQPLTQLWSFLHASIGTNYDAKCARKHQGSYWDQLAKCSHQVYNPNVGVSRRNDSASLVPGPFPPPLLNFEIKILGTRLAFSHAPNCSRAERQYALVLCQCVSRLF